MPVLTININQKIEVDRCNDILTKAVDLLSEMLGKPKGSILVQLNPESNLVLGEIDEPAVFLEFKLFDFGNNAGDYIKSLTHFVQQELGVAPDRQFQEFTEMKPAMFGWNGASC